MMIERIMSHNVFPHYDVENEVQQTQTMQMQKPL